MTQLNGFRWRYDVHGRTTEKESAQVRWRYRYDAEHRLTEVIREPKDRNRPQVQVSIRYDPLGRRISKTRRQTLGSQCDCHAFLCPTALLQGKKMIDLREPEFQLAMYAQKYQYLMPEVSPGLQQRMEYMPVERGQSGDCAASKPEWLQTRPQSVSDAVALDKAMGALVGLAAGDAVGTTLEFLPRDESKVTDMVGGGPFRLKPGEWTDDTSMALCLAETYLEAGKMDVDLFRKKLVRWYHYGENSSNGRCFDIGNTTRFALDEYLKHGQGWFGNTSHETAGNAAIIRHAPVAIFRRKSFLQMWNDSKSQSLATHGAAESISSCQFLGALLHYFLNGYSKEDAFSPHVLPSALRVLIINAGEYKQKTRDQIRSSGYVID
uniref:ADP-ribosylglycohydrolase family protein n=2 Tax=Mixta calida TaxID=665913 RepID=UPI00289703B5